MIDTVKAPSGRRIWKAVRDELMLNLYPLPFSTLAPTVYHVYLHPDDFGTIEHVVPRIVAQIEQALTAEVEKVNRGLERSGRRMLNRLPARAEYGGTPTTRIVRSVVGGGRRTTSTTDVPQQAATASSDHAAVAPDTSERARLV